MPTQVDVGKPRWAIEEARRGQPLTVQEVPAISLGRSHGQSTNRC
jgi:hypothetical protein